MNKTKIEWVRNPDGSQGYTWNPITGCLNGCPYCYARKLANGRLRPLYLANTNLATGSPYPLYEGNAYQDPFYPRFWPERLWEIRERSWISDRRGDPQPKGIFVCDMGELFGDWIPRQWQEQIFEAINADKFDRFYLLTKQPQNLIKWDPFPENCWVGVTATSNLQFLTAIDHLSQTDATVKFISFEPLLNEIGKDICLIRETINWLIIGACTGTLNDLKPLAMLHPELALMPYGKKWTLQPKLEWVEEIVRAADKAGIPVFLKNNLYPLLGLGDGKSICHNNENGTLRQEMPK